MSLKPYPEYTNSQIDWLGEVPKHWTVQPATAISRVLTSTVDKKSYEGEILVRLCNYTDVYYNDVVRDNPEYMKATATAAQIALFTPRAGDVAITKDSETSDDIGIPSYVPFDMQGIVFGYHLAIYRPEDKSYGRFLKYLFESKYVKVTFENKTPGVTRVGLSRNTLKYLRVPTPPVQEALAIADYLDRETEEIDAFIADQEELITLLAERRTATITHAVTKGLDPSVQMRESGVEWLGDVPTHWSVAAIRNAYLVLDCKHVTAEYVDGGDFPLASIREVKSKFVDLTMARRTTRAFYELLTSDGRKPSGGDLIISRNASVGQVAMVAEETRDFCMGQDVSLIRATNSSQSSAFLQYVLESDPGIVGITMAMIGSTFKRINVSDIKSLPVVLPPIREQLAIVAILDRETAEIDAAISDACEAIALSKERRSAMISATVTGKIDVRGLVAPAVNEVEAEFVGVA